MDGSGVVGNLMNGAAQGLSPMKDSSRYTSQSTASTAPTGGHHFLPRRLSESNTRPSPTPPKPTASQSLTNGTWTPTNGNIASQPVPTPPPSRRPSWLTNISSKFSGTLHHNSPSHDSSAISATPPSDSPAATAASLHATAGSPPPAATNQSETKEPGFLLSTLRRLSVSGSSAKEALSRKNTGIVPQPQCERMVLNRDIHRQRCCIPELDGAKLRKVAFCVDVEVAPSPEDIEARKEARRRRKEEKEKKEKEMKMLEPASETAVGNAEGKDEDRSSGERDRSSEEGPQKIGDEKVEKVELAFAIPRKPAPGETKTVGTAGPASAPVPTTSASPPPDLPAATSSTEEKPVKRSKRRIHARPTTDPIKIYSQCCQLRETPVLAAITSKLTGPGSMSSENPGVVQDLDLTGYKFSLPDCVAFSDFLALVPVKRLVLEDCDLTDQMVRVILSALNAVKVPYQPGEREPARPANEKHHQRGVIEKLSLKGNVRIGQDGWRYISCFVHMSHSLRSVDLSKITLPRPSHGMLHNLVTTAMAASKHGSPAPSPGPPVPPKDRAADSVSSVFARALGERLVGHGLEELWMGQCCLTREQLRTIMEGVMKGGTTRLGLEGNSITDDGLAIIGRWIKGANGGPGAEALDLSNNNIQDHIDIISASINEISSLRALSLSNCNLTAQSLESLLPALATDPALKWLDLSQNPALFSSQPHALPKLRRFIPHFTELRKLDLSNTSMTADHIIALCEVLPEAPNLAHLSITDNHLFPSGPLASEMDQEEGAALYTALIAAVEVSKTIVRVDIDEPGSSASAIIRNLSKRLLAYCLKNIEAGAANYDFGIDFPIPTVATPAPVEDREFLTRDPNNAALDDLDTADPGDGSTYVYDDRGVWRDEETYIVGGTGVVKALGVCLGSRSSPPPEPSHTLSRITTSSSIPAFSTGDSDDIHPPSPEKAKEMSKALLSRARKIKLKIQPALRKPYSGAEEELAHRRLVFLDATLGRVIRRFEEEYPECREPQTLPPTPAVLPDGTIPPYLHVSPALAQRVVAGLPSPPIFAPPQIPPFGHDGLRVGHDDEGVVEITRPLSRRNSEVSLHARSLQEEEGKVHRIVSRKIREFKDAGEEEGLGERVDEMGGDEIRLRVLRGEADGMKTKGEVGAEEVELGVGEEVRWEGVEGKRE